MSQIEKGIRTILTHPKVYDLFQNLLGARKVRTDFTANFIRPNPDDNILDIGCGTADTLAYLPSNINYFGFDQSEKYIKYAQQRFGSRGKFECAIVDDLITSKLPKMNIALAIGLIHHLNDEEATTLLNTAKKALGSNGRFICLDPCYDSEQSLMAKWLIDRDRGENVRDQKTYIKLAKNVFDNVESSIVHRKWIPYTYHIMTCSL